MIHRKPSGEKADSAEDLLHSALRTDGRGISGRRRNPAPEGPPTEIDTRSECGMLPAGLLSARCKNWQNCHSERSREYVIIEGGIL
ncbi:MAG: hypothetical protein DRQ02_09790 [Candidatus Latescibacterota bacterium]|nr:MAG: hypothetical protein DRQ02_09790 [Candidatus Latescibacterota bacterium]